MSEEFKVEDGVEAFTILDEIQEDEIDLTFDDEEIDNTDTICTFATIKNENAVSCIIDEEENEECINPRDEETNIVAELDNENQENNVIQQNQMTEIQSENKTLEECENNAADAAVADLSKENDKDTGVSLEPADLDAIISNQDICKTFENSDVADDFQNEISEVPDVDNPEDEDVEAKVLTHPYLYLIETFEFQKDQLNLTAVEEPKSIGETQLYNVFQKNLFMKMIHRLRNASEIGVDCIMSTSEYEGTVCLIAISTKDADYIIDAVKLKPELLLLTEIFINPKIVKILIHTKKVLKNLQHKLHLYMVNVFDIARARVALGFDYKTNSLFQILKKEYKVDRGQFTRPDFRQKPLPEAFKTYVRLGTHYLIHIYHIHKNQLLIKGAELYKKFLEDCRDLCKVMYTDTRKESFQSLENILKNHHQCELEVAKKLFDWRQSVAQKLNIKPQVVMHNSGLIKLAKELPNEEDDICEKVHSPYLKHDQEVVRKLIQESRRKFSIFTKQKNKKQKALKRKANNQPEVPSKLRYFEHEPVKMKPVQGSSQKMQNDNLGSSPNKYKDFSYSKKKYPKYAPQQKKNFNIPNLMDKKVSSMSFFNNTPKFSGSGFDNTVRNRQSFQQPESRFPEMFNNNANINNTNSANSLLLNPTNIPSPFTFQPNSLMNSNNSNTDFNGVSSTSTAFLSFNEPNDRNNFQQNMQSAQGSFMQPDSNDQDAVYKTLVDLKQARDNIRMQAGRYTDNFSAGRLQDLNIIDQKISMLEIKIQQMRHGGNKRDKRRYFH